MLLLMLSTAPLSYDLSSQTHSATSRMDLSLSKAGGMDAVRASRENAHCMCVVHMRPARCRHIVRHPIQAPSFSHKRGARDRGGLKASLPSPSPKRPSLQGTREIGDGDTKAVALCPHSDCGKPPTPPQRAEASSSAAANGPLRTSKTATFGQRGAGQIPSAISSLSAPSSWPPTYQPVPTSP